MADPITSIIFSRLALYAAVAEIKGEEKWSEENVNAALYLLSSTMLDTERSYISVAQLAGLDDTICAPFAERMRQNGMVPSELTEYYEKSDEESGVAFQLDVLVLLGMLDRVKSVDGSVGYKSTPAGKAKVESELLPKEAL